MAFLRLCVLAIVVLATPASCFVSPGIIAPQPGSSISLQNTRSVSSRKIVQNNKTHKYKNKPQTQLSLFEDDDISALNCLAQFGPAPFFIRLTQSDKYWAAVEKYQKEEGTTKVDAVRNMDAYFADPIGWGLKRERAKTYGEIIDYNSKKTGVQKRPLFSLFMLGLTTWFFFSFLPTRMNELGGPKPSALKGGFCPPDVRVIDEDGRERFECAPKGSQSFPFNLVNQNDGKLF